MKAKLGIAPIAWWNDDLPELSGDVTLEQCLAEARVAGFTARPRLGSRLWAYGAIPVGAARR